MDERPAPTETQARELDRVGAFSDGVFAIAITLLVLNLEVPGADPGGLGDLYEMLSDHLEAYFISFAVVGSFWYGHHKVFSLLDRSDGRLVFYNLVLLAVIALMPFTTDLLGTYGNEPWAAAVYAANLGAAALADGLIEVVAKHRRLAPDDALRSERELIAGTVIRASVFFLSIPLAYVSVTAAQVCWLLLILVPQAGRRVLARKGAPAS